MKLKRKDIATGLVQNMQSLISDEKTTIHNFSFLSCCKEIRIHGYIWVPYAPVRGIVQISHGMTEHIKRYDDFARYLNSKGILVVGHNHLGHGTSINNETDYGYFTEHDAPKAVVCDILKVTHYIKKKYPGVPYFLLGHSMGSFFARRYLIEYGSELDGALILGTGNQSPLITNAALLCAKAEKLIFGSRYRSKLAAGLFFGPYNKRFQPVRTPKDWLTKDMQIIDEYLKDPACTFSFTVNGYETMLKNVLFTCNIENIKKMPKELPVLIASGEEDPVGNYGKDVKKLYAAFYEAGMKDVSLRLYPNDRHELLNETDRQEIYQDLWQWIYSRILA